MHLSTTRHAPRPALVATFMLLLWLGCGATAAEPETAAATPPPKPEAAVPPRPYVAACASAATFRVAVDVGHTEEVPGALSARGATEYSFNLALAREIDKELHAAGFERTVLMITTEAPPTGLFKRVARAADMKADLLLAVHHDSVPDALLETWQFDGQEQHFNDRFPGHSIFISNDNSDRAGSFAFAKLLGNALEARGLHYTPHYTEKFMGSRQRELLDPKAGVYRYDQLIVLRHSRMPAALLEAGSIINRTEELALATPEHQALTAAAVVEAVDGFCEARNGKSKPTVAKRRS